MGTSERRKGLRGQQEVQRLFRSFGIELDKLAAQGDRVWHLESGEAIRLEVKWQARTQMGEWIGQSEEETPSTMIAAVIWRRPNGRWRLDFDAEDAIGLIA